MSLPYWSQTLIKSLLSIVPRSLKPFLFELLLRASSYFGQNPYHNIFRLPFNLVVKTADTAVEAGALRFVEPLKGINTPLLIDSFSTPEKTYILSTWIEGDCCSDIWETLTPLDRQIIVEDMRAQYDALREQTSTPYRSICNASGGAIQDPRLPWLEYVSDATFSSREFME